MHQSAVNLHSLLSSRSKVLPHQRNCKQGDVIWEDLYQLEEVLVRPQHLRLSNHVDASKQAWILMLTSAGFMLISCKCYHSIVPPLFIKAGVAVEQVDPVKHLGVLLTSDLMWTEHTSRICNKTWKLIGLMYRRFHHCHPDLMLRHYKAFICPHLEYTPQVWDPYLTSRT